MGSTLHAYRVHVHKNGKQDDRRCLGDLLTATSGPAAHLTRPQPKVDLYDLIPTLMPVGTSWPSEVDATTERHGVVHTLQAPSPDRGLPRRWHGRLLAGNSGVRSDLRRPAGALVRRDVEDVEERPLYFWLNLPERSTSGLLLVERHGHLGVRTAFWQEVLVAAFRARHHDLALKLDPFYPVNLFQEYEEKQGKINKAVIIAGLRRPAGDSNLSSTGAVADNNGHLAISVKRRWRGFDHQWGRTLLGMSGPEAISYVLPEGPEAELVARMEADKVVVGFTLNDGTQRQVELGQDYAPRAGYVLPEVRTDEDGYPALGAMLEQVQELEPTLMEKLGVS